jgi:hypothetical protein
MDRFEELTAASLRFAEADRRHTEALQAFTDEVAAKKSDLSLSLACKLAEASEAWDKAEKRLKRAAKKMRCFY